MKKEFIRFAQFAFMPLFALIAYSAFADPLKSGHVVAAIHISTRR